MHFFCKKPQALDGTKWGMTIHKFWGVNWVLHSPSALSPSSFLSGTSFAGQLLVGMSKSLVVVQVNKAPYFISGFNNYAVVTRAADPMPGRYTRHADVDGVFMCVVPVGSGN